MSVNTSTGKYQFADLVFPIPVNRAFTYIIPEKFRQDVAPGSRALVPFGRRKTTGFIVDLKSEAGYPDLKEIEEVLDPVPLFTPEVLQLARWIADYYICGWGEVLKAALPAGIHLNSEKVVRLVHNFPADLEFTLSSRAPRQAAIVQLLREENPMSVHKLERLSDTSNIYSSLKRLRDDGHVRLELLLPGPKVKEKYETFVRLADGLHGGESKKMLSGLYGKSPKQAECLSFLLNTPDQEHTRAELVRALNISSSVIKGLVSRGLVRLDTKKVIRDYYGNIDPGPPKKVVLNPDQQNALEKINARLDAKQFATFLLYGVTGSGKTQVYIEAIYHALYQNRTAIVLVPEISLTPQMVSRFRSHFGDSVAVFHSRMSPGERYDSWRATWEGQYRIVIGPRSAIFTPLKNIGLIVVDEEHVNSYKQYDLTPRYHARDVSIMRAKLNNALVVLGSATPAVETFFNARIKKYQTLGLPKRIDDIPMPEIKIVDMRKEPRIIGRKEPIIFSRVLREKIDEKLALGEQIILLQNRRGFATFLKCKDCGYIAKCNDCDITLTFHLKNHLLKCHYCGHIERAPLFCPNCQGLDIFYKGIGTQRVEEELHELFPGIPAARMDLDTTRGRRAHDKILSKFGKGEFRILLGTQMVAKGLDFPNVTLVGVISADTELLFPDFRAGERAFQLLTQVSGRSGRKEKQGEVVIQTFSPDHYSLYYTQTHDYENFFKVEIMDRKELSYPPFSRLINIVFKGQDQAAVQRVAEKFYSLIDLNAGFEVKGPAPAALSKIQGNFRWQILFMSLKSRDAGAKLMKDNIRRALQEFKVRRWARKVTYTIDVDPVSIL